MPQHLGGSLGMRGTWRVEGVSVRCHGSEPGENGHHGDLKVGLRGQVVRDVEMMVMEELKTTHMRASNICLLRVCCSKGAGHHHLRSAETQRQAEERERLVDEESGVP